jgi:glucarate dehydratase
VPRSAAATRSQRGLDGETSEYVAHQLEDVLEYLGDPTATIEGMAAVAKESPLPLATDMCVIAWQHLRPTIEQNAIQVLRPNHHYWGGLRRTRELAAVREVFGLALSMHSNSHLGISLAAMTHVAAAIQNLDHSRDTHSGVRTRDDTGYMRRVDPTYELRLPRW